MNTIGDPADAIKPRCNPLPPAGSQEPGDPQPPQDLLFGLIEDIAALAERHRLSDRARHEAQVHGDPHGLRWLAEHDCRAAEEGIALARQHAGMICAFLIRLGVEHYRAALSAHLAELPVVADLAERVRALELAVAGMGGER